MARATVQAHRIWLEERGYRPSTINQRLAAVRKLARKAAWSGLLAPEIAAGIDQGPGAKQRGGQGTGSSVSSAKLLKRPDPATLKGKRGRAVGADFTVRPLLLPSVSRVEWE